VGKPAEETLRAARLSADINEAYNAMKQPLARARALLALHGIDAMAGADATTLMEMIELQEAIADGTRPDIAALIHTCDQTISTAFRNHDFEAAKHSTIRLSYLYKMEH
jgi:DnaJ-domain-containing protein 1